MKGQVVKWDDARRGPFSHQRQQDDVASSGQRGTRHPSVLIILPFTLLGGKISYSEAVGQTGAQGLVRGCGPYSPAIPRRDPARDEASLCHCLRFQRLIRAWNF